MSAAETKEYLDAEQFVAWLYEIRPELDQRATSTIGDTGVRALHRWREQGHVTLDAADKMCCVLDLHLLEIPDEIWIDPPERKKHGGRNKWVQIRAREMREEGFLPGEIARILEVSTRSVETWTRKVAA